MIVRNWIRITYMYVSFDTTRLHTPITRVTYVCQMAFSIGLESMFYTILSPPDVKSAKVPISQAEIERIYLSHLHRRSSQRRAQRSS